VYEIGIHFFTNTSAKTKERNSKKEITLNEGKDKELNAKVTSKNLTTLKHVLKFSNMWEEVGRCP